MHIKRQVDSSLHDTNVSQSEGSVLYAIQWWVDLFNHICRHIKRVQNYKWGLLHPTLGISGHFLSLSYKWITVIIQNHRFDEFYIVHLLDLRSSFYTFNMTEYLGIIQYFWFQGQNVLFRKQYQFHLLIYLIFIS